jgi:hypothetical protein
MCEEFTGKCSCGETVSTGKVAELYYRLEATCPECHALLVLVEAVTPVDLGRVADWAWIAGIGYDSLDLSQGWVWLPEGDEPELEFDVPA